MAESVKRDPVTKQELDIFGISMSIVARVGDKTFHASVSPIDWKHFKKDLYLNRLHKTIIKNVEYELSQESK